MIEYVDCPCPACGEVFGLLKRTDTVLRKSCQTFYCPFGHQMSFSLGDSEATKLRRERDRLTQRLAEKDDEIARQRELQEAAERRVSAARGQITKLKNRAAAGVCPCCTRHFVNLERHMASKHKGFVAEVIDLDTARA
jgi:chromosome segregation ATPase